MLRVARSGKENGGFGARRGRTGITNVGGEEVGVDTGGVAGRVIVNFSRPHVWRYETVFCVGVSRNPRGRRRRVGRRERAGRHASDEELEEDTGQEGDYNVNQGELTLSGRILDLLRGE